jgi:uncharacterized membrane protein
VLPLVVAILTGAGWLLWAALPQSENGTTAVVLLAAVGVLGAAASVLHTRWAPELAAPWRETAAAFLLIGLFVAALPWVPEGPAVWTTSLVLAVGAASALAAAAVLRPAPGRWEILGALAAGVSAVLVALAPQSDSGLDRAGESVAAGDVLVAVASMALFVAVAVGVAVVGTLRDSWRLTATATLALVVFTTVQSFSVFALILEGSLLFMALGLVLVGTGVGFDRVRRRLAAAVLDDRAGADR